MKDSKPWNNKEPIVIDGHFDNPEREWNTHKPLNQPMTTSSTGEKKLVFINDNFSGHFWENGTYHNPDSCYVCIAKNMKEITHIVGEVMTKPPTPQSETPHKEHGEWESIFYRTLAFNDLNWNYKNNVETTPKEVVNFIRQLLLSTQQEAVEKERKRSIRRVIRMIEDFYEDDSVERALLISRIEKLAKDTI